MQVPCGAAFPHRSRGRRHSTASQDGGRRAPAYPASPSACSRARRLAGPCLWPGEIGRLDRAALL